MGGCPPAPLLGFSGFVFGFLIVVNLKHPKISLRLIWFPLEGALGVINFCTLELIVNHSVKNRYKKKPPAFLQGALKYGLISF